MTQNSPIVGQVGRPSKSSQDAASYVPKEYRALAWLAENNPEVYRELMVEKKKDQRHRRRIAWAGHISQMIGSLSGLTALVSLLALSWHMTDARQGKEAAVVVTTGAVSIVAIFVTGKWTKKSKSEPAVVQAQ
ncbi:hypothetical protein [Streptomyces shenzhenensis]|uniref:hypothetical protein n=1 Tax=Streptomyces shenzhenensis TaxID=943815 RepID=UPI0015F0FC5F|nr:hypothetical protein [Streptomyces shenzhenensis]